jgi:hypothetical protein
VRARNDDGDAIAWKKIGIGLERSDPQSRQSAKMFLQSSDLGLPQPLTPRRVCPPPPLVPGEGAQSLGRERVGESQFRRGDIHCGTLYIYLCTLCSDRSAAWWQVPVLPEYLGGLGYRCHAVGKWHLGSHTQAVTPTHRDLNPNKSLFILYSSHTLHEHRYTDTENNAITQQKNTIRCLCAFDLLICLRTHTEAESEPEFLNS